MITGARSQAPRHSTSSNVNVPLGSVSPGVIFSTAQISSVTRSAPFSAHDSVRQTLNTKAPTGAFAVDDPRITPPPKDRVYTEMEALIQHFLIYSQGFTVPEGEAYVPVEGPRGEHGFYVISDGTNRPWRVKSRAPSLLACQALERLIVGGLIADVIAVIGSVDVVMGDVDR